MVLFTPCEDCHCCVPFSRLINYSELLGVDFSRNFTVTRLQYVGVNASTVSSQFTGLSGISHIEKLTQFEVITS